MRRGGGGGGGGTVKSGTVKSPPLPPEKKAKKEKTVVKPKKVVSSSSTTDGKIAELDLKWSERFNRLEALLMAKSFQPSFSSDVRVTPSYSPPPNVGKITDPFYQPTSSACTFQPVSDYRAHWPGLCCWQTVVGQ